jgi:hypothetical protein
VERKIITLLLLFVVFTSGAQVKENICLFTDRDLYVSGETLLLKVFAPESEQSGIVNIDLINRKGTKITGIILEIIDHQADGFVYLPDSLSSGFFLLRTSTRTSKTLTIKEIYVANRFKGLPETNNDLHPLGSPEIREIPINTLQVEGIEKQYNQRANGRAILNIPNELIPQIDGNLLVSISRVTPEFSTSTFQLKTADKSAQSTLKEGIVLEGIVTGLKTGEPFKNAIVYLSVPDSIPGFQYYITSDDGRFYFQLGKYYGKIPVVIQCFDKKNSSLLRIELRNKDSLRNVMPSFESRHFPAGFRASVEKNIEAITFRKIFNQQEITIKPIPVIKRDDYPFYGISTKTVDPHLFIDLPDFNEISKELLSGVKFRNYNRIPTMQVLNDAQRIFFSDQPLILLDGIPVRDINVIKDMGTKDIKKVEICMSERFYGDLIFPGIVAIYSSKADYTRLPESADLIKLNLDVIQPFSNLYTPTNQQLNEPDLRQVLIWKPSIKPEPRIAIDFQTSDVQGSYKLILHGKTKDGSTFYKEQIFEVN